jgi:hypothetical protein
MFHIYQKDGSWRIKGNEHMFFLQHEEAVNAAAQIGQQMGMTEFDIMVEVQEPAYPSPYEQILGFQICNRCGLHPCEC